jgi:hypothetical protein
VARFDDILAQIPIDQIAGKLGVDSATATAAVKQALPTLLSGMQANAQDPRGAASLAGALNGRDTSLIEGGVNVDQVDTDDGEKIVRNVFGENKDQVISTLGGVAGGSGGSGLIAKVLPMIAPIVMAYLAKQFMGGKAGGGAGGGLGDLLGSVLGGGKPASGGGGGLGDLLGSVLGGGGKPAGGGAGGGLGGLGDLLGGLLGGGKR